MAICVKLSAQSHPPILMSRVNLSVIHREALLVCCCIAIHNATMKIFPPELAQVFIYRAKCSRGTGYNYLEFSYKGTPPRTVVYVSRLRLCCERSAIGTSVVTQLFLRHHETYSTHKNSRYTNGVVILLKVLILYNTNIIITVFKDKL